ncbi:uncharacterized protein LOC111007027 [Momordica charantia]|uniref:Uncharacterized protein LOC111007027 n=1 Tax=Momordica charantia TaxID=3673 RepID=A0A6J1BZZ1_MOMCH|nr:uncharacterized protein LOC111007027 [Momordica charantia]XP_022134870.1 uncharacterized protein LOC111007027 [Momordica charantia]
MLVARSFDLWQKDAFFSAAEEVQESADILESTYRTWLRERRARVMIDNLDEFTRELRTALGTAKWQLEEFEKAVRLSYGHHGDDTKLQRHRQFIDAIENQIFSVEASLREYFVEEGKQPLKWVNLDEEECDDLAAFLSGTTPTNRGQKNENLEPVPSFEKSIHETHSERQEASSNQSSLDTASKVEEIPNAQFVVELEDNAISLARDDVVNHTDRTINARRVWSSPNFNTLTIVIPDEDEQRNPMPTVEATPKEKGSRTILWRQLGREFLPAKVAGHVRNQLFARFLVRRQLQSSRNMPRGCSVQLTLALMLSIFFLVPFVLYST